MPKVTDPASSPIPSPTIDRPERLAINLFDLDQYDPLIRQILLTGKVNTSSAIRVDKNRPDETAVELTCDLLTAGAICDTLRVGETLIRVYIKRRQVWTRVPYNTLLTVVEDSKIKLNPLVFFQEIRTVEPVPMSPRLVVLGGESSG